MAARSIGTATISFGLVTVPVRMYTASESSAAISFNMLHGKCGSRLKQQYICTRDEEIVPRDQMVKGYEFAKDQYVTFTEAELKAMAEESTRAIEITEFVPLQKVDPVYFESSYYLGPDKGGERAYALLAAAMRQTGRCALAKWAARGKMYLVMLRPVEKGLVMQVLLYADEVRPFDEVPVGDSQVKDSELKLAIQLIDQIATEEFRPENYEDEVRKRYNKAIEEKVQGREITASTTEEPKAQIIDLMEALKASLGNKTPRAAESETARKPAKRSGTGPRAVETKPARAKAVGRRG
jgi:DNA end-binding protein Ku